MAAPAAAVREVLDAKWADFDLPRRAWRIPISKSGKARHVSVFCAWHTARKSVGLSDVRMHDLRHSFASLLINSGRTLYEVQHILGHTQVKTTQRYAHLSQDTLLAAANAATVAVGAVMLPAVMMAPVSALPAALRA